MRTRQPTKGRGRPPENEAARLAVAVKMTAETKHRLRLAAAEDGTTQGKMISHLLGMRDERKRRVAASQVSPLHRPKNMEQL